MWGEYVLIKATNLLMRWVLCRSTALQGPLSPHYCKPWQLPVSNAASQGSSWESLLSSLCGLFVHLCHVRSALSNNPTATIANKQLFNPRLSFVTWWLGYKTWDSSSSIFSMLPGTELWRHTGGHLIQRAVRQTHPYQMSILDIFPWLNYVGKHIKI